MNRFLRSALFPVVVITLIVWLGTQTLIGHRHPAEKKTTSLTFPALTSWISSEYVTLRELLPCGISVWLAR